MEFAKSHGVTITFDDLEKRDAEKYADQPGEYDAKERKILISNTWGFGVAGATLAHELEHARQHCSGEWTLPSNPSLEEFVEKGLQFEREAENASNQVAYELGQMGLHHLRKVKSEPGFDYHEQATAFFASRDRGETPEQARSASLHLWDAAHDRKQKYLAYYTGYYLENVADKSEEKAEIDEVGLGMTRAKRKKRSQEVEASIGPTLGM